MPKIVDKAEKRAQIAQHALELFARHGFENTPVRAITAQAGIGKGTFYDYFQDKNDVLNEILSQMFSYWQKILQSTLEDFDDPVEKINELAMAGLNAATDFEQLTVIYLDLWRKSLGHDQQLDFLKRFKDFIAQSREVFADIIEEGKARGHFRQDIDSGDAAVSLIAMIDGLGLHASLFKTEIDPLKVWQVFFSNFIIGLS